MEETSPGPGTTSRAFGPRFSVPTTRYRFPWSSKVDDPSHLWLTENLGEHYVLRCLEPFFGKQEKHIITLEELLKDEGSKKKYSLKQTILLEQLNIDINICSARYWPSSFSVCFSSRHLENQTGFRLYKQFIKSSIANVNRHEPINLMLCVRVIH